MLESTPDLYKEMDGAGEEMQCSVVAHLPFTILRHRIRLHVQHVLTHADNHNSELSIPLKFHI